MARKATFWEECRRLFAELRLVLAMKLLSAAGSVAPPAHRETRAIRFGIYAIAMDIATPGRKIVLARALRDIKAGEPVIHGKDVEFFK